MRCALAVRRGFFPLDEELQLLAGQYTPTVYEGMTRLGTWLPFRHAAAELAYFTGVVVSETTARRVAEQAGAAYVAVQTAEVTELEQTLPQPGQALLEAWCQLTRHEAQFFIQREKNPHHTEGRLRNSASNEPPD